jgi:hypothetical protein
MGSAVACGALRRTYATASAHCSSELTVGDDARTSYQENRLEDGDVQEALDAALAVGDFDTADSGHHGTPEQREEAWNRGFEAGDPSSCNKSLNPDPADGGAAPQ